MIAPAPSSSADNALFRWRRRRGRIAWAGAVVCTAVAAWAVSPPNPTGAPSLTLNAPSARPELANGGTTPTLDVAVFARANLWNPPTAASSDATTSSGDFERQEPRTPLRLVLVAIIDEADEGLLAALYDPDRDELLTVRRGDHALTFRVESLTPTSITLHDGRRATTLTVRRPESTS